jgi:hypothetical protein
MESIGPNEDNQPLVMNLPVVLSEITLQLIHLLWNAFMSSED